MCENCIAPKSGLSAAQVQATVVAIEVDIWIYRTTDRCRTCGTVTTVLSLSRPF
jgi:hypothetical protein